MGGSSQKISLLALVRQYCSTRGCTEWKQGHC